MTRRSLADRILRLYPRVWRERYGDEVRDLVEELSSKGEFSTLGVASGLVAAAVVQRVRSWRWSWRTLAVSGTALVVVATLVIVLDSPGPKHLSGTTVDLTKGTIPSSTNVSIDSKKVPDFISTWADGKIGYIPRAYVLPSSVNTPANQRLGQVAPVYGPDLKKLVGHMYPGVGFVPLGKSITSVACIPAAFTENSTTSTIPCPSVTETVPNVVGMYVPTGMVRVQRVGLQPIPQNEHSRSVPNGYVIRTSPSAGTRVPACTPVIVFNSLGPSEAVPSATQSQSTLVSVPNTIGLTQAKARATLHASDLLCSVKTVSSSSSSSSVGIGHVLSQEPFPGSRVAAESTVVITVSSGP